jgi:hypothetical protein
MDNERDHLQRVETDESIASRLEISFDGTLYTYRNRYYELFRDAVNYALADRARTGFAADRGFRPSWKVPFAPTDGDEHEMRRHGIGYVEGHYLYDSIRFNQLRDAIAYAAGHPNQ